MKGSIQLQKELKELEQLLEKNPIEAISYTTGEFKINSSEIANSTKAVSAKDYLPYLLHELREANLLNKNSLLFLSKKVNNESYVENSIIQHPTITDDIKTDYLYFQLIQILTQNWLNEHEKIIFNYLPGLFDLPPQITFLKYKIDTQKVFEALHAENVNPRLQILFHKQLVKCIGHPLRGDESMLKSFENALTALNDMKERDKLHYDSKNNRFIKLKRLDNQAPDDKDSAALEAVFNTFPKEKGLNQSEEVYNLYHALTQSEWFSWQYREGTPSIKIVITSFLIYAFDTWFTEARRLSSLDSLEKLANIIKNSAIRHYLFKHRELGIHLESFLNRLVKEGDMQIQNQAIAMLALLNRPLNYDKVTELFIENQIKSGNVELLLQESGDKELVLDDLQSFELKEADKTTEAQRYGAFRKVVTIFNENPELDASGVNEKHLSQYIRKLIQGLSKKPKNFTVPEKTELEKGKNQEVLFSSFLSKEGKAEIDAFICFLAKIDQKRLIYWDSLKKDINNLLDSYIELLYKKYANDYKENRLGLSYMVSQELKNKKSFEEQIFTLELLIKIAEKGKARGNKAFYQHLRQAILSVQFIGSEDEKWGRFVSLKSQEFLYKHSLMQRLFHQKQYRFIPHDEIVVKAKKNCNNNIYYDIASENNLERFRRKHQKKVGLFVGIVMAIGGSAFMFVSILPMLGFFFASIISLASFIVNGYLFKGAVSNLIDDGLFKIRGYPIRKEGMKIGLAAFLLVTTITAMALGILTFSAMLALCAPTFGIGGAIILGALFGGVTWIANTALFTGPLKELFAYLDEKGLNQALSNLRRNIRDRFLSLEDCRFVDEEKTNPNEFVNKRLLLQKICQLTFQSLFILVGIVAGIIATISFVGMLRVGVLDFISYSQLIGAQVGDKIANIAVRVAGMCSQLPLALSSAVHVFSQIGVYIGEKVCRITLGIYDGIKLLINSPKEIPAKLLRFMGKGITGTVIGTASAITNTVSLITTQPINAMKLTAEFLWHRVALRVAIVLNAIGSAFMSESGLYECKNYTRHFNDELTSKATYASNGILAYVIPSNNLESYTSAKKKEERDTFFGINRISFFEMRKIEAKPTQEVPYKKLSNS